MRDYISSTEPFHSAEEAMFYVERLNAAINRASDAWSEFEADIKGVTGWVEDDCIKYEWYETWAYGGNETHNWCLPLSMLWDTETIVNGKRAELEKIRLAEEERQHDVNLRAAIRAEKDRIAHEEFIKAEAKRLGLLPDDDSFFMSLVPK